MVYEQDIPKALEKGEVYTGEQISAHLDSSRYNTVILMDSFHILSGLKYKVISSKNKYVHISKGSSVDTEMTVVELENL